MDENIALYFDQLSKTFGRGKKCIEAVKDISLTINSGQFYGFLGPNGAGKTTTIRLIMDLILPTRGAVYIFGQPVRQQHAVLRKVGAIVERATFYNFLTGQGNLEVLARTGDAGLNRIPELLNMVGLSDAADKKVGEYSTGMKQRLGLAAAQLGDPELLILDEPTGGLDPAGILEVRNYLRELVDHHGKTVFLSSHMLSEVEQVCDRVAIIHKGEIVREGMVADLLSAKSHLRLRVSPVGAAAEALRARWSISDSETSAREADDGAGWLSVDASHQDAPQVLRLLVENGIDVYQIVPERISLETFFMQATQGEQEHD
jgi:ABC-2 type transport system ATP-binding protein